MSETLEHINLQPAVGYCRYSSNAQREESIAAQKRAIGSYCAISGYEIVEWYCDEAVSGTTDKRPEFQRLISDIENHKVKTLIVHKLDRFSRNKKDTFNYMDLCEDCGVKLISVSEPIGNSPADKMMVTVLSGINEYYSLNLSGEVMKGMKENAYKCESTGGPPPLGYDMVNKKLVINEKEAEAVRLIYEMCAEGYGYGKIIDRLNLLGYRTKKGNKFAKNSLCDLITNEKYKGVYVFNKRSSKAKRDKKRNNHKYKPDEEIIRIPGGCPAIVSEELWNKANSVRKVTGKFKSNAKRQYLLTGMLVCGECGAKMHGNLRTSTKGHKYMTYRCNNRINQHSCSKKEIRTEIVDDFVLDEIFKNFFTDATISKLTDAVNKHKSKILSSNDRYQNVKEGLEADIKTRDVLIEALEETSSIAISSRIKEIEEKIATSQSFILNYKKACRTKLTDDDIKAALEPLKERMKKAESIEQTKLILSHLIDKIVISDSEITLYLKFSVPQSEEEKAEEIDVEPFVFDSTISRKAIETYKSLNQELYVSPDMFKTRLKSFTYRN
ncbi:MAG: recombinase family protein [Clostridia bacterium]|nr:recombinase family protein [Clostridia bacterium]